MVNQHPVVICEHCKSREVRQYSRRKYQAMIKRYFRCLNCGKSFQTVEYIKNNIVYK